MLKTIRREPVDLCSILGKVPGLFDPVSYVDSEGLQKLMFYTIEHPEVRYQAMFTPSGPKISCESVSGKYSVPQEVVDALRQAFPNAGFITDSEHKICILMLKD